MDACGLQLKAKSRDARRFGCPPLRGTLYYWLTGNEAGLDAPQATRALASPRGTHGVAFQAGQSHFHECPLVPKYKSCISVNCWSWILKHGNAEGSPGDRDPALTTGLARSAQQPVTSKSHCQSFATRTEQIQHLTPQLVSLPEVQRQRIGRRPANGLRDDV